jgi:hypothetical protein
MQKISELKVYFEVFHFNHSEIVRHLHGDYPQIEQQLQLPADEAQARRTMVQGNHEYLAALQKINEDKILAFKVFPHHLPTEHLRQVLSESRTIVVLRRNLLHSYLSGVIAINIQKWSSVDTSQEKVVFSSDDFCAHVSKILDYYYSVVEYANNKQIRIVYIDYEQLATMLDPLVFLTSLLSDCLGGQVLCSCDGSVSINRQDKRNDAASKVVNADEMLGFLKNYGLPMLNNGFVNCADDNYARIR